MPALGSHMARARRVAERLALPEIDAHRGAFYVGSTAPDIRVITRNERHLTHFFDLDDFGEQDSIARMFAEHPGLAAHARSEAALTAFLAGYLTHLALDETFIGEVYRPHFGAFSSRQGDPRANVLDRALQYELDRRDRVDRAAMGDVGAVVAASMPVGGVPFIEDDHLREWAVVSADVAMQPPDYSRFRRMMTRHLRAAGYTIEEIDRYCEDPHGLVAEAIATVGEERIARFWRDAEDRMSERVTEYLR